MIGSKNIILSTIGEILFQDNINESYENYDLINYVYNKLFEARLLMGEPVSIAELRNLLRKKILNFKFIKLDGTERTAKGTLMMKYVPQSQHPKGVRPSSHKVATFYDLVKRDWRSVSQRSKEIVLEEDPKTKKPVVVVTDKNYDLKIGSTYEFDKLSKNKNIITTYITITEKKDDGYWGKTVGSSKPILLNDDRLKRLGSEIKVGETYEFTKLNNKREKVFTNITITKKDDEGYWGKTDGSRTEILLSEDRMKRLGQNVKNINNAMTTTEPEEPSEPTEPATTGIEEPEGQETPIEEIPSEIKNGAVTELVDGKKMYHFRNKLNGAGEDLSISPKDTIKKLKELGKDWNLLTDKEFTDEERNKEVVPAEEVITPTEPIELEDNIVDLETPDEDLTKDNYTLDKLKNLEANDI